MPVPSQRIPPAPAGFEKEKFFAGVHWHQIWQIFEGVFTPGVNPIQQMCEDLALPDNLSGKRVLDIGAWNGCMSFECARRGAREVVAVSPEDPQITGFNKLRELLGARNVHYVRGTVYNLDPRQLGTFDVVLFCGVLYHLRYPTLGIDNIRRVCKGEVYAETVVSDFQLIVKEGEHYKTLAMQDISPVLVDAPLWQFYRFDELGGDASNWFGPNCAAVVQAFESAGFETRRLSTNGGRATFHGKLKSGPPEFLSLPTTEGVHYDTVTSHLLGVGGMDDHATASSARGRSFGEQYQIAVLSSKEYYRKNGNNDRQWINSLYLRLLGRECSPSAHLASKRTKLALLYGRLMGRLPAPAAGNLPARVIFDNERSYREAVVEHLLTSTEHRLRLLKGYYGTYLHRAPSPADLACWMGILRQGASPELLLAELLGSEEYYIHANRDNRVWLKNVCADVSVDAQIQNIDLYLEALEENRSSRSEICRVILESLEYRQRLIQFITQCYLDRPTPSNDAWLEKKTMAAA